MTKVISAEPTATPTDRIAEMIGQSAKAETPAASLGAFARPSPASKDSALLETLNPGPYTAVTSGLNADSGVALAEVYDATPAGTWTSSLPRLMNLSARASVGTAGKVPIAGFVIAGSNAKTILIRASGPALGALNVSGALFDPQLQLCGNGSQVAGNIGWNGAAAIAASAAAFPWEDPSSDDSALLVTLPRSRTRRSFPGQTGTRGWRWSRATTSRSPSACVTFGRRASAGLRGRRPGRKLPPVNPEGQPAVELRSLVGHRESVDAGAPLEDVHRRFAETGRDFLAVLDGGRLLGVCARREIAMQLGARFGFALFARSPVREHLMAAALRLSEDSPLPEALASVSARSDESFYDDVLLVDAAGGFIGFILVHALVRLQTELLLGNIAALERSRQEVAEKNKAMEDDLLMAREVQLAMLPSATAERGSQVRWRFHSRYAPAGGVSGDFFQLMPISDSAAGVLVCDVMGHGVRSALVTAMIRAFSEDLRSIAGDPGALLTRLNRGLMGVLRQAGNLLFVTAAYAVVDAEAGTVRYGQAGHPTGFIRRGSGAVDLLPVDDDIAGPALGLIDDHAYSAGCSGLAAGDTAILFTDGIFEVRNAQGEEWGQERLRGAVAEHPAPGAAELLSAVLAAAGSFAAGGNFDDDVCIVALGAAS